MFFIFAYMHKILFKCAYLEKKIYLCSSGICYDKENSLHIKQFKIDKKQ